MRLERRTDDPNGTHLCSGTGKVEVVRLRAKNDRQPESKGQCPLCGVWLIHILPDRPNPDDKFRFGNGAP